MSPQDSEGLKALRVFLNGCDAVVHEIDAAVSDTMTRIAHLGRFNRQQSFEDSKAMWEAKRWPGIIANASADALAYLDLLTESLSTTLLSDRTAFEAALASFPDKVLEFYSYGDITKSEHIAEQALELQDTFDQALRTVKGFNQRCVHVRWRVPSMTQQLAPPAQRHSSCMRLRCLWSPCVAGSARREEIFGRPVTEHDALSNIIKDFAPFFQLWTMVSEFDTAKQQWLAGPFGQLNAKEIASSVEQWWRDCGNLIKKFRVGGCNVQQLMYAIRLTRLIRRC